MPDQAAADAASADDEAPHYRGQAALRTRIVRTAAPALLLMDEFVAGWSDGVQRR